MKTMRQDGCKMGFAEIQTPILANSSPEGARDFLVPSRLQSREFYALPQAPQQFKQLLMISGFDKYLRKYSCFRDEDPRADRAPGSKSILRWLLYSRRCTCCNGRIRTRIKKFTDEGHFIRIPYREAMEKYGIDKPDLRNPLIIQDATEIFAGTEFKAYNKSNSCSKRCSSRKKIL